MRALVDRNLEDLVKNEDNKALMFSRTCRLLTINLTITLCLELGLREVFYCIGLFPPEDTFFNRSYEGYLDINRQSLINITMTGVATLVGSWVLFSDRFAERLAYFLATGLLIALLSQLVVFTLLEAKPRIQGDRIIFDVFYTTFVKFPVFELGRRTLVHRKSSYRHLIRIRLIQDLLTSTFRVSVLSFFKIR